MVRLEPIPALVSGESSRILVAATAACEAEPPANSISMAYKTQIPKDDLKFTP